MDVVLYGWPWLGLAVAIVLLAALLTWPRPGQVSRWRDPSWLVCLTLPVYMLHQFEEHGTNLLGQRYQFLADLCAMLGYPDPSRCPADPVFVLAVNCGGGVWLPGLFAILFRRSNPLIGACVMGIPLVNALFHIGPAVALGAYNSGLATAVLLFVPMCAWTLAQFRRRDLLGLRQLACVVGSGLLVHAVLIGSVLGRARGLWGQGTQVAMNIADFIIPLALGLLAAPTARTQEGSRSRS
jgi:hypothetical protein